MIPPDVASLLRTNLPDIQNQARREPEVLSTTAAQRVPDVLSNLSPGTRILAEVQALLPNGSYRAIVAQREITLALPFSAKAGDTLELEVSESNGKTVLAFIARRDSSTAETAEADRSVRASLSPTGRMIGDLLSPAVDTQDGKKSALAALNNSRPLITDSTPDPARLAQTLRAALTESGVFYEAHQARWVKGELPVANLLREPQGKLSPILNNPAELAALTAQIEGEAGAPAPTPPASLQTRGEELAPTEAKTASLLEKTGVAVLSKSDNATTTADAGNAKQPVRESGNPALSSPGLNPAPSGGTTLPGEITQLVRQQLESLANQQFAWQGLAWQGQPVRWEISEFVDEREAYAEENQGRFWQTRVALDLPALGGIEATIRLSGRNEISVTLKSATATGENGLRSGQDELDKQLTAAGFSLKNISIQHVDREEQPAA